MIRRALVLLVVCVQPLVAAAHDEGGAPGATDERAQKSSESSNAGDEIPRPPPTYKANDVTVIEKLGAQVPLDAKFRKQDGNVITLGHALQPDVEPGKLVAAGENDLPTILTFNYSECPMLCNLQLNGLTAVMPALAKKTDGATLRLGEQFRIVTIDLEPNESLEKLVKFRERYISRLPADQQASARKGWTFLVAEHPGDATEIRRVAQAVGFSYTYVTERAEWAHPASIIMLSTRGIVTRYVHGIEFDPAVMRESIFKAGKAEPASAIGFINRCYHYDPDANNHSHMGVVALRVAAAVSSILLFTMLGVLHIVRRSKGLPEVKGNPS
jgi:protein SCO1/2